MLTFRSRRDGASGQILAVFVLAMVAISAVRATESLVRRRLRDSGVPARATVVEIADCDRDESYWVDITYRYRVGGLSHFGHRQFDRLTRRWHPGDRIRVVYDPQWPSLSAWVQSASGSDHRTAHAGGRSLPRA